MRPGGSVWSDSPRRLSRGFAVSCPGAPGPRRAGRCCCGCWHCCGRRGWVRRAAAPLRTPSSTSATPRLMFKGFEKVKDVQYIYTPFDSSLCGVKLEANSQKQYLLTGQVLSDGKVFIHLCNYIEPWENLSFLQRESLNHHYHLNCGCQITTCYTVPCTISAPNECLWTDWLLERKLYGYQAQHYVCMKHVDGTCSWYQGHLLLRKEFVDIIQP
ncbi:metalloproteinase inhibitor 4 isoform X2 [Vulpes lagopus]|uniref:metalloproteinase inhibitor 4 isoform X2 n=1 Tax=Vulpes lagopus TaxID=494514 RepID=UPI001BC9AED9|nr:metalloproteinase inhibitor 4 isoform X2 [Vulpes lagopus]